MLNSVEILLRRLGLEQYAPAFRRKNIDDLEGLRSLTKAELSRIIYSPEARQRLEKSLDDGPTQILSKTRSDRGTGFGAPLLRTFAEPYIKHTSNPCMHEAYGSTESESTSSKHDVTDFRPLSPRQEFKEKKHFTTSERVKNSSCTGGYNSNEPNSEGFRFRHKGTKNTKYDGKTDILRPISPTEVLTGTCDGVSTDKLSGEEEEEKHTDYISRIKKQERGREMLSLTNPSCHLDNNSKSTIEPYSGPSPYQEELPRSSSWHPGSFQSLSEEMAPNPTKIVEDDEPSSRLIPRKKDEEVIVTVPASRIRVLLANKADHLSRINRKYNVINSKISKPVEGFVDNISFTLYGTKEAIRGAKAEIEHIAGVEKEREAQNRLEYLLHEPERNLRAMEYLALANIRHQGTELELSESLLKRIASYLRYKKLFQQLQEYYIVLPPYDSKRINLLDKLLAHMEGKVQGIVFCHSSKIKVVVDIGRRSAGVPFMGGLSPVVLSPPVGQNDTVVQKVERMEALEQFKNGVFSERPSGDCLQRLLVTTDDYARYARKVDVPYVNLIFHYTFPRTKEAYLLRCQLLGRGEATKGFSFMFVTEEELSMVKELQELTSLKEMKEESLNLLLPRVAEELQCETKEEKIVSYDHVEPCGSNWREEIYQRAQEKQDSIQSDS